MKRPHPRAVWLSSCLAALMPLSGCHVHEHRVGGGAVGAGEHRMRQFYMFFGFLRLNQVEPQRYTANLSSYDIVTEFSFIDLVLSPLLLPLTVTSRTVVVSE
ncbi:MAG: hypothetical protein AAF628_06465 [Planctomycetota bacterium]